MKNLALVKVVGIVALASLGALMAASNPSQSEYEEYALKQLTDYLKNQVCPQAPQVFDDFVRRQCKILVDSGRPQIKRLISENTYQQNFVFFSIYRTDLSVTPFLPSYHFETVGAFQTFYIYQAEKL